MLAYKRTDWDALARHREIGRWADEGLLDDPASEALLARFPQPFYSPNVFYRIGLFVFGLICASAGVGLFFLSVGASSLNETGAGTLLLIYGAGCLLIAEMLLRRAKPFFRAGLEEAACYSGLACLIAGFLILTSSRTGSHLQAWTAGPIAILLGAAALRYADRLLAAASFLALAVVALDLGQHTGTAGIYMLPASLIALSTLTAWGCDRAMRAPALAAWDPIWTALRLSALLLAYAAGNYWIVREWGSAWILDQSGTDLPSAWAFYAYTFAVPIAYVAWGLARKDRLCLDAGLIVVAAAVLTYKAYHNVLPIETGLTLVGIALLTVAWACLKAFRPPRFGLSTEPRSRPRGSLLNAEALAAWAAFGGGHAPGKIPEGFQGGGGKFGGGGAGGNF